MPPSPPISVPGVTQIPAHETPVGAAQALPPLHSLVAWPPAELDGWLRRTQERLNVRAFGLPHLNLRAPFRTPLGSRELVSAFRHLLAETPPFEVRILGWKQLPHALMLECERAPELLALHRRALEGLPSSQAPYDGDAYMPHLTLALGILPWAEAHLWEEVRHLTPPISHFTVTALSLTREMRGEVQELHTFPLEKPSEVSGEWEVEKEE